MPSDQQQTTIRTVARLAVAAALIYGLYAVLYPFLFPVITGGIISTLTRPAYEKVKKVVRLAPLAALLTILGTIILIALPLGGLFTLLVREISSVSSGFSDGHDALIKVNAALTSASDYLGFKGAIHVQDYAQRVLSLISERSGSLAGNLVEALGGTFIALVTAFYLLQSQAQFHKAAAAFSPLAPEDTEHLFNRTREMVKATVTGNLVLVGLQAMAATVGFMVFGISSPLFSGVLYGISSLIPGIGSSLIWLPIAAFQLAQGNVLSAIGVTLWSLSQVLLLDNFVGPRLIQYRAHLHPFLILLGVLGGVSRFGVIGIVVGPTVIALGMVGLEILSRSWKHEPAA